MVSEAPPFWWTKRGWQAVCLSPFALVYGNIAAALMRHRKRHALPVPVICVGNFTVGGAGKTPTAITIARAAIERGMKPGFLSRGYGGSLDVTTLVDAHHHRSTAVGDEPLLLAREATTVISRRRIAGASRLVNEGVDLIIMDDGFQSARLAVDYAVIVLDSMRGIGNGCVVPSGPVRAPLAVQMQHLDALLKVGRGDAADQLVRQASRSGKPVMVAQVAPKNAQLVKNNAVLAYAGIADPGKFYRSLEEAGATIKARQAFPDHHHLAEDEMADLLSRAEKQNLQLVTTAKDHIRLSGQAGLAQKLAELSLVLEIEMVFDDPDAPNLIIDQAIEACRRRRLEDSRSA